MPAEAIDRLDHPELAERKAARESVLYALRHPTRPQLTSVQCGLLLARYVERERVASILADLLKGFATSSDLTALLDTHEEGGWVHSVARSAIRRWIEDASFAESAEGASVCVLWAAQSGDEALAEFVCDVILKRATARPHSLLRGVLPILQQVANQRRLKRLRRGLGAFRAIQQDKPFGETYVALEKLLPLRDLPIPVSQHVGMDSLPHPSEPETVAPVDLPTPAITMHDSTSLSWWKRWISRK